MSSAIEREALAYACISSEQFRYDGIDVTVDYRARRHEPRTIIAAASGQAAIALTYLHSGGKCFRKEVAEMAATQSNHRNHLVSALGERTTVAIESLFTTRRGHWLKPVPPQNSPLILLLNIRIIWNIGKIVL